MNQPFIHKTEKQGQQKKRRSEKKANRGCSAATIDLAPGVKRRRQRVGTLSTFPGTLFPWGSLREFIARRVTREFLLVRSRALPLVLPTIALPYLPYFHKRSCPFCRNGQCPTNFAPTDADYLYWASWVSPIQHVIIYTAPAHVWILWKIRCRSWIARVNTGDRKDEIHRSVYQKSLADHRVSSYISERHMFLRLTRFSRSASLLADKPLSTLVWH